MSNKTISTTIGAFMGWLWNIAIPFINDNIWDWAWHTVGAVATSVIVAFCVFRFNKFLSEFYGKDDK